jgi:hypothetical protein
LTFFRQKAIVESKDRVVGKTAFPKRRRCARPAVFDGKEKPKPMKKFVILASIVCLLFSGSSALRAQTGDKKDQTKSSQKKDKSDKDTDKKAEKPAPKN